jgi:hypothetical protein
VADGPDDCDMLPAETFDPALAPPPAPVERHVCDLPAEWVRGKTWHCRDGHLWTVSGACGTCWWLGKGEGGARHVCTVGLAWWPARWWQRVWHRGKRAELWMAGANRVRAFDHNHEGEAP